MAFARVETSILNHKKFGRTHLAGVGLWTLAVAYSMDQLTNGRVPKDAAFLRARSRERDALKRAAEVLIEVGLWTDEGDYYQLHDYLDWNPSAEQIKADREAARERMRERRGKAPRSPEPRPPRSPEQPPPFNGTRAPRSRQDVEVEVDIEQAPPEHVSGVRPNGARAHPPEAFNHDCTWPGRCVNTAYFDAHPDAGLPVRGTDGQDRVRPKQCPHHREQDSRAW